MGIEKYRVAPGVEEFRSRFEQNLVPRAQFNLKTTEGALVGIPTFDPIRHGTDKFQVHTPDGHVLMIPFADLEAAEDHVASDDRFMDLAISEARRTPPEEGKTVQLFVGAALVLDNEVLGTAYRGERTAGHHAERTLLETKLGDAKRDLSRATLYTTLEPCTKEARSANEIACVELILRRRLQRVVIGMLDPDQRVRGEGILRLREVATDVALCNPRQMRALEDLNRDFIAYKRTKNAIFVSGAPPPAPPPAPSSGSTPPATPAAVPFDWSLAGQFLSAEIRSPIVYRAHRFLSFHVRLRTQQRIPPGLQLRKWRVTGLRVDGLLASDSKDNDLEFVTLRETGTTELQTEVIVPLDDKSLKNQQLSVSGALFFETHPDHHKVQLPLEEAYCRNVSGR